MPRKKDKLVSLEVMETNATWDYRGSRTLHNFICKKDDAERVILDMDTQERWKHEKKYADQVKSIFAPSGTRNSSNVFFTDEVAVEEVKLPKTIKATDKYIYKVYDYFGDRVSSEYGNQKDILAYVAKKIKTKYAYVSYNGVGRKIEYTPKTLGGILNSLEATTSQLEIEPLGRSGNTDGSMIISIFNNRTK